MSIAAANPSDFSKPSDGCTAKRLDPRQSCTVRITFNPSANGSRSARLSVTSNAPASPQTVALLGTGVQVADLGITLSATPDPAPGSGSLTYTVNVSNHGPDAADGVKVTDVIPSGSQFASITANAWSCTTPPPTSSGTVTCTQSSIPSGGSSSFTLTVSGLQAGQSTVTNTAQVSGQSTDPTAGDNTATVTTPVQAGQ